MGEHTGAMWRSRWAAIGAAVAVTLGAGGLATASAISSGERTVFVPITPCRIMDTRPGQDNRGPRATPIGNDETHTIPVRGVNGDCNVPADAVGVALNVTALNGTSGSFLTVFPAGAVRPKASSLNWLPGQSATPNAVTADLAADGRLSLYNFAGSVDVIADVVGYYADHDHDDRYYTKAQVDTALAGKADGTPPGSPGAALLGSASFLHDNVSGGGWFAGADGLIFVTGGTPCFMAAVELPNGATVTGFTLNAEDDQAGVVTARLFRDPEGETAGTLMASVSTTANSGAEQVISDTTIADAVVNTAANMYQADVCMSAGNSFYSVRVDYTNP